MNQLFKNWLDLGWKLGGSEKLSCPSCGNLAVDFQYVGDTATRIGYLDIWCEECRQGIHISRVQIPGEATMLDIHGNPSIVISRIPKFTWVLPKS